MKSQDILILLKLVSIYERLDGAGSGGAGSPPPGDPFSVRALEMSLGISKSEVSASLKRSLESGLAILDRDTLRPKPGRRNLANFIKHGIRFVFPARVGALQRGIPTGFAAPALRGRLIGGEGSIHVWPFAKGSERGQSVEPLFKSVPEAITQDDRLYEYLALVDAIRLGNQRESKLASEMLDARILRK